MFLRLLSITTLIAIGQTYGFAQDEADETSSDQQIRTKLATYLNEGITPIRVPSLRSESESIQRIKEAFKKPCTVAFVDEPLEECCKVLAEQMKIPIRIDVRSLDDVGLTPEIPITFTGQDITLRSTLNLILQDLDLTYRIEDEVLQITTTDCSEANPVVEVYVLPERFSDRADAVIHVIQTSICPEIWQDLGGPSTICSLDELLIVATASSVHFEIEELLRKIAVGSVER